MRRNSVNARTGYQTVLTASLCFLACAAFYLFRKPWLQPLTFDDAFMFTRYARNVQNGLGISWNLQGGPTFGLTSIPWMFFVLIATKFLPAQQSLQISSMFASGLAVACMACAFQRQARTPVLTNPWCCSALVIVTTLAGGQFRANALSGMDTMLALAANSLLVATVLNWQTKSTRKHALLVGIAASFTAMVRLDSGLCALFVPLLAWIAQPSEQPAKDPGTESAAKHKHDLLFLVVLPIVLIGAFLLACWLYFGAALPNSFYMKAANHYVGFLNGERPIEYFVDFLSASGVPIALIVLLANLSDLKRFCPFLVPTILSISYLFTVRQIMGWGGRFFFPQLPFILVPSLLVLDGALAESNLRVRLLALPSTLVMKVSICTAFVCWVNLTEYQRIRAIKGVPVPGLVTASKRMLPPIGWFHSIREVTKIVQEAMPQGGTIAASEVGYLGESLPNINIIDLAGLNDAEIARHGFSMNYLLAQRPELIWLPHSDYTGLTSAIVSDPRLLSQYTLLRGAFNYGIAIRKDGKDYNSLESHLVELWPTLYPGTNYRDYIVTAVRD
jgi:hypothetical protein